MYLVEDIEKDTYILLQIQKTSNVEYKMILALTFVWRKGTILQESAHMHVSLYDFLLVGCIR